MGNNPFPCYIIRYQPRPLHEAAQIDGAKPSWKRLIYITLPALANTTITVFILNLAKVMNLFESVFVTMNDAVVNVSNVLQTYVYRKTSGSGNLIMVIQQRLVYSSHL